MNFVADPDAPAAENAFVRISLEEHGTVIRGGRGPFPRVECFFDAIFVDQPLKFTFALFFAPRAGHGMVEEDELKLEPPRFGDFLRVSDDLHALLGRCETSGQKF